MRGRFVEENEQEKENKDLVGVRKPKKKAYEKSHTPKITSQCSDSNRGPAHYECAALPAELHWHRKRASARTRTEDLRITNAPLYQLSYTGLSADRLCERRAIYG